MAGFEVFTNGRFWVFTEGRAAASTSGGRQHRLLDDLRQLNRYEPSLGI
jgi:hypothetical protein